MTISLIGTPPGIIGNISNKRLLHFFLFGGGGAGAGNGGFAGGNGAALAFSAYLEKEDVLYMYNGIGGTAGGTSTAAIGGGGGGSSFIYADVRKTRLGSNPNGYGVNSNLLLAAVGGGGGGGTETNAYGGNAGLVNTSTGATLNASTGGGTNPGTGGTATGPGLGGIYDAAGLGDPLYFISSDPASQVPLGGQVATYDITTTSPSSSYYTLNGTDRNGYVNGNNAGVGLYVGDTINFNLSSVSGSHPFYIRVSSGGSNVSTPAATGQGSTGNDTVSWTPSVAGTYYYQCGNHGGMIGTITVSAALGGSGAGGKGYTDGTFTINSGGGNTGDDEANVVGSSSVDHGHGRDGYQNGGAGGGGGYYGGGGSSYDGGGSAVGGGGGGSSFILNAIQYCGGHNILSSGAPGDFAETNINGFNLTSLSSIPINVGNGGAGASSGVAGSNGQGGYIVILDTNGNIAAQTTGATSGWKYTVV